MDFRLVYAVQASLMLFLGGVVLFASIAQRRRRVNEGATWFATAFLACGTGIALQAQEGRIGTLVTVVAASVLYLLSGPLMHLAIAKTLEVREHRARSLFVLAAGTLAVILYATYMHADPMMRMVTSIVAMATMQLMNVLLLLRCRESAILPATRAMAMLLVMRVLAGVVLTGQAVRHGQTSHIEMSWFGAVTICGLALSYLWIGTLRLQAELEETAMTDPLTRMFSRRALHIIGARELQRASRRYLPCSAVILDVDRFVEINERLGYAAGDAALTSLAITLNSSLRASDIAVRLGGDEFFVLLPEADEAAVEHVVERVREMTGRLRMQTVEGTDIALKVSIGHATLRGEALTVDALLSECSRVMAQEKEFHKAHHRAASISNEHVHADIGGAQVQPSNA